VSCPHPRHTAAHCNKLQHTATYCNTLQHTAARCSTLQHNVTHCNTLQHTATHCNTLQHTATHCKTLIQDGACNNKFSKILLLLKLQCQMTINLTFEKFMRNNTRHVSPSSGTALVNLLKSPLATRFTINNNYKSVHCLWNRSLLKKGGLYCPPQTCNTSRVPKHQSPPTTRFTINNNYETDFCEFSPDVVHRDSEGLNIGNIAHQISQTSVLLPFVGVHLVANKLLRNFSKAHTATQH